MSSLSGRPTKDPLNKLPESPFNGKSVEAINAFVKNNFPGWGIDDRHFIVLDDITARSRNGLLVDNSAGPEEEGRKELALLRVALNSALLTFEAVRIEEQSVEELADDSAGGDGAYSIAGPV